MVNPYIIGISGPTSAGKSYFAKKLIKIAKRKDIGFEYISTDDFYKDLSHLSLADRNQVNYDHPDSIDGEEFKRAITELQQGKEIEIPKYDFTVHNRKKEKRMIRKQPLIIVEGIFAFAFDEILRLYSLKVYVDLDRDLRLVRRIRRDMRDRGRSLDSVIKQHIETVRPTQKQFVENDKNKADLIIYGNKNHNALIGLIFDHITRDLSK